jgi:hypothetical protein
VLDGILNVYFWDRREQSAFRIIRIICRFLSPYINALYPVICQFNSVLEEPAASFFRIETWVKSENVLLKSRSRRRMILPKWSTIKIHCLQNMGFYSVMWIENVVWFFRDLIVYRLFIFRNYGGGISYFVCQSTQRRIAEGIIAFRHRYENRTTHIISNEQVHKR